jgi:hypothetical protein
MYFSIYMYLYMYTYIYIYIYIVFVHLYIHISYISIHLYIYIYCICLSIYTYIFSVRDDFNKLFNNELNQLKSITLPDQGISKSSGSSIFFMTIIYTDLYVYCAYSFTLVNSGLVFSCYTLLYLYILIYNSNIYTSCYLIFTRISLCNEMLPDFIWT